MVGRETLAITSPSIGTTNTLSDRYAPDSRYRVLMGTLMSAPVLGILTSLLLVVWATFSFFLSTSTRRGASCALLDRIKRYYSRPTSTASSRSARRGTTPGPILFGRIAALDLGGLTVVRTLALLPLRASYTLPFGGASLSLSLFSHASETVFDKFLVQELSGSTRDLGREAVSGAAKGVDIALACSLSSRVTLRVQVGAQVIQHEWRGRARVSMACKDASMQLELQLVDSEKVSAPSREEPNIGGKRVKLLSSDFGVERLLALNVDGFGFWGRVTSLIGVPLAAGGTILVQYPARVILRHVLRELLEGDEAQAKLINLWEDIGGHIELNSYGAVEDEQRDFEVALFASTAAQLEQDQKRQFALQGHLVGPTVLQRFDIPDSSPALYRPHGTRAALQKLNLLTQEIKLDLWEASLSRISFERSSIAFTSSLCAELDSPGGELVINVAGLEAEFQSRFKVHAQTSSLLRWTTGRDEVGEQGTTTTRIKSQQFQLRFRLSHTPAGPHVSEASMSPLTSIAPFLQLSTFTLGAEMLNTLTSSLETTIAYAVSEVLRHYFLQIVRLRIQTGLEEAETRLMEDGVELPAHVWGRSV